VEDFERHHMSEELTPKQYELSQLLGNFYGYRLENYKLAELGEALISLIGSAKTLKVEA
jgi:hypothetical protein